MMVLQQWIGWRKSKNVVLLSPQLLQHVSGNFRLKTESQHQIQKDITLILLTHLVT